MRIPVATYRLQFGPQFGFRDAAAVVPYLARLGVTDIYASPVFKARSGSAHGYDVVDPRELNPELGSTDDFEQLHAVLKREGIGWVQDIVPNHMAIDSENAMLTDVLELGKASRYFNFFDIDWDHPFENMRGRLLVPLLGRFYSECLAAREIRLSYGESGLSVSYYQLRLPIRIGSYLKVLEHDIESLELALGGASPEFIKYLGCLQFIKALSDGSGSGSVYKQMRHAKRSLWQVYQESPDVRTHLDGVVSYLNGDTGDKSGLDKLDSLLSEQLFRLAFWRVANEEINYRRFFTVNDLISLRMEREEVFEETHALVFDLVARGIFSGLRVDHIDGLYDPTAYLGRLRDRIGDAYVVVEKILEGDEELPPFWPVQGTTGYDALNVINGVFCDERNRDAFSKLYYRFAKLDQPYDELLYDKISLIINKHVSGNIENLAQFLKAISGQDRYGQDITMNGLRRALVKVMAHFPVYRTYMSEGRCSEADRRYVREAIGKARERFPELLHELNFIEKFLLLEFESNTSEETRRQWLHFVMGFQQYTGPLMAKGFEDTVMYIYNRLVSLNEVGGNPNRFGGSVQQFHGFFRKQLDTLPHSMSTTATHDTKRGEDTRARINVLSEIPDEWERSLKQFAKLNRTRKRRVRGQPVPDRNDEYFLYQTLLGVWPAGDIDASFVQRIKEYSIKAVREAKVHTAWIKPDSAYEDAFLTFIDKVLSIEPGNAFVEAFQPLARKVAVLGKWNSLSQVVLKATLPGVPDFYQGTEFPDLTLVDPDNRRPVDYNTRRAALDSIATRYASDRSGFLDELLSSQSVDALKLFVTWRALQIRRSLSDLYQYGDYEPLEIRGEHAERVIAFAREHNGTWGVTIAARLMAPFADEGRVPTGSEVWSDTQVVLPAGAGERWYSGIDGSQLNSDNASLPLGRVFATLPAAILTNVEAQ
ncbi:malto-oligosyltrehalose synthase [bacterium]|nr:malto-oligosyltrehalose synthase [bacterium]